MSPVSGRITVVERGSERRLILGGEIQSVYFADDDWTRTRQEYWGCAIRPAQALAPRSRALLIGLGGGTQIHLLRRETRVGVITVIERDPAVIGTARQWFGLDRLEGVEILSAEADHAIGVLRAARRRFAFIMDDISYASEPRDAARRAGRLRHLLTPRGVLVLNQHYPSAANTVAATISQWLPHIRLEPVRRDVENVLIYASRHAGRVRA